MDFNFLFSDPEEQFASDISIANNDLVDLGPCPVHKKYASVSYDYDEHGTYAHIRGYCCKEFAYKVAKTLDETRGFTKIYIKKK